MSIELVPEGERLIAERVQMHAARTLVDDEEARFTLMRLQEISSMWSTAGFGAGDPTRSSSCVALSFRSFRSPLSFVRYTRPKRSDGSWTTLFKQFVHSAADTASELTGCFRPSPNLHRSVSRSLVAPLRATGITIALFCLGPGVYYAYVEVRRNLEISRRRRRFELKRVERERRRLIEAVGDDEVRSTKQEKGAKYGRDREPLDDDEMDEIRRAFGSFAVGGRWSNALGWEWREQGGELNTRRAWLLSYSFGARPATLRPRSSALTASLVPPAFSVGMALLEAHLPASDWADLVGRRGS